MMVVLSLTACPEGLRGNLSRWLFEISPGVFVGNISARVRDAIWKRVLGESKSGRAVMVHPMRTEQHLAFRTFRSDWTIVDCDGLELVRKPSDEHSSLKGQYSGALPSGWSNASRWHKARYYDSKRKKE